MREPPRATGWPGRRMEGQRALAAAKDGDLATLKRLLEAGALGPGIVDALGAGLVHHAARAGRLACVKFLVRQAELPGSQRAHNGATPVHDAAATGSLAELRWLVRDGGCGLQVSGTAAGLGPVSPWIGGGREPWARESGALGSRGHRGPGLFRGLAVPAPRSLPQGRLIPNQHKALVSQGRLLSHLVFPGASSTEWPHSLPMPASTLGHVAST